jgi:hypothetical protein
VVAQQKGNEVTIQWTIPHACYPIQSATVFVEVGGNRQRHEVLTNEIVLLNLEQKTQYTLQVRLNYADSKTSPLQNFDFYSGECAPDTPNCE